MTLVCNKISAVDVIVEEGKGSVTITGTFKYAYDDITFTAPTAGRYVIFSPDCPELPFGSGEKDEEGNDVYRQILTVDVTKPGDVTVQARYFPWSVPESGKMEYTYVVTRYEDTMTLRELVGSGYTLPTNVDVTIHFTAPKKGQYQISSSMLGLAWNDYLCDSIVLVAEEDNQSMSFTVRYENSTAVSYDFDWSIVLLEAEEVAVGENTVTAPYGQYSAISFVADRAGAYMVRVEDPFMRLYSWSSELQSMSGEGISYITASLNAGDEVELFLSVDIFDYEGTDDITGIVTVLYLGHVVEESNGAYISFVSFPNTYVSGYEASDFILTVSAGAEISTDGSNWSTSVQVSVADYGVLTYYVRTTGGTETVAVSVTRIAYEFTLEVGTHSHSMIPGKEYTVYLSGTVSDEWYVDYILTWSQENVEVFFNGYPVASGEIIENYSEYYALSIVYTGSETTGIEFTLVDPLAP